MPTHRTEAVHVTSHGMVTRTGRQVVAFDLKALEKVKPKAHKQYLKEKREEGRREGWRTKEERNGKEKEEERKK